MRVRNGFAGTRTLINSLSQLPKQTEHPILPGLAVCQCLEDEGRRRFLGMGQMLAKTRRFLPRGVGSAKVTCRATSAQHLGDRISVSA